MDKDVDADINDEDDSPVDEKELNDLEVSPLALVILFF